MKWITINLHFSKVYRLIRFTGEWGRIFIILSICSMMVIILAGILVHLQNKALRSPSSSIKGMASSVSYSFFMDMLSTEIPMLQKRNDNSSLSNKSVLNFAFRFITDVNPYDPKSLLANEIPGIKSEKTTLLYGGKTGNFEEPLEYDPKPEVFTNNITPPTESLKKVDQYVTQEEAKVKKPAIFIYHSHNRESWLPELKNIKDPDLAFDPRKNVTLLGARIAKNLEKLGIDVVHSAKDYPSTVTNFKYPKSYQYSKSTVTEAFTNNPDLKFLFDVHRDSQTRSKTTITINNKEYAQVYFVVGEKNPNWESNMQFAKKIHDRLNEKYPGLSKGIYSKSSNGNGEYNQSLSPNVSLIEIGGVEITLEESYRTADILSEVFADLYRQAEKVSAPVY